MSFLKKNQIKHIIINVYSSFAWKRNEIIFESFPDFSCNSYELYRYMVKNGVNEKYRLVWLLHDGKSRCELLDGKTDCFELKPNSFWRRVKAYKRRYNARAIISCNSFFPKYTGHKNQLHFYLDHSSQLKDMRINGERIDIGCDYYFSQSVFFVPYHIQQYAIDSNKIVCLGLPRIDQFYKTPPKVDELIENYKKYKKIIIWAPTFRRHFNNKRIDCDVDYPFGVPIIYTTEELDRLLNKLAQDNILLIIKPHPAQDVSRLSIKNSDFLRIINDKDLSNNKIQLNEFLNYMDALVTDYSSIYYDYLELKKPIAITLDDYESYSLQKGFVFEDLLSILKGEYLYTIDDFIKFVDSVSNDRDASLEERETIRKKINDYQDGLNSKRVMDFIISKLEKQKGKYIKT